MEGFLKELGTIVNKINEHPYIYVIHCPYCYGLSGDVYCGVCNNKRKLEYLVPPPFKNWTKYLIERRNKTKKDFITISKIIIKDELQER